MKQRLKEWLNIKVGNDKPKDAMEAHQLAKHFFHVARRQKMFGSDCTENMKHAKKFYEQYKEFKRGGDYSDNDTLEEVDIDDEIENFQEAKYKRPAVAARNRDIGRKSSNLRGKESVSSKTTTTFKKRHGGKTVANRPGTEGVPRSTGATGDKRALGGQGAILQDLHNMPEDEFRRKHGKSKSAARTHLRNEETNEGYLPENSITVSMHKSGTKYKVHGVHKSIKGRITPGEHLSDTHIDDLRDSGVKIRHVKPKPTPKTAKPAVMGYRKEEEQKSSIGTPLKQKRSWNPKTHKLIVKKKGGGVKVVPKSHPGMEAEAFARRPIDHDELRKEKQRNKMKWNKVQLQPGRATAARLSKMAATAAKYRALEKKSTANEASDVRSEEVVHEAGMSRVAYQKQSGEKGSGVKTFKKKPAPKKVKEYGVEKERELAAKGDRYEEVDPKTGLTPSERHRMTPEWAAMLKRHGERKKRKNPPESGNKPKIKEEHAPEVVEYISHAYDYNRKSWMDALDEVNRYKGRSGHRVTKPEKEEPEHIIMQMRKVESLKTTHSGVHFKDGSKAKIDPAHARQVINRHDSATKPADKEHIARTAAHSHDGLKHVANGKKIDHTSPGAPKKPMFKAAARRDPLRGVRHPDAPGVNPDD